MHERDEAKVVWSEIPNSTTEFQARPMVPLRQLVLLRIDCASAVEATQRYNMHRLSPGGLQTVVPGWDDGRPIGSPRMASWD